MGLSGWRESAKLVSTGVTKQCAMYYTLQCDVGGALGVRLAGVGCAGALQEHNGGGDQL